MPNREILSHDQADQFIAAHGYRAISSRPGYFTNGHTVLRWEWLLGGCWVRLHVIA